MNFDEKLAAAKALLASKGINRRIYAPTLATMLWRLDLEVPPPHFAGFFGIFVVSGGVFAGVWGVLMWLLLWSRQGMHPSTAIGISAVAGVLVGVGVAGYYRYSARKHSIPAWESF